MPKFEFNKVAPVNLLHIFKTPFLKNTSGPLLLNNLDIHKVTDNKTIWKTIKPSFTEKLNQSKKKKELVENDKVISEESEIAEINDLENIVQT